MHLQAGAVAGAVAGAGAGAEAGEGLEERKVRKPSTGSVQVPLKRQRIPYTRARGRCYKAFRHGGALHINRMRRSSDAEYPFALINPKEGYAARGSSVKHT